jgi:hypothetical protein
MRFPALIVSMTSACGLAATELAYEPTDPVVAAPQPVAPAQSEQEEPPEELPEPRGPAPVVPGGDFEYVRFVKGSLHSHSTRSDGQLSIEDSLAAYAATGFDFVATTDHDYATVNDEFSRQGFVSLGGEEISPWFRKPDGNTVSPHVGSICGNGVTLGLTADGFPFWLGPPTAIEDPLVVNDVLVSSLVATIRQVREVAEALPVLNHPNFRRGLNSGILLRVSDEAPFSLLEIANQNDIVLTRPDATHEGDEEIWDVLLSAGHRVFGLATDDSHSGGAINQGWIQVASSGKSARQLCQDIARGRFYASTGVALSAILFRQGVLTLKVAAHESEAPSFETQFIGTGGVVLTTQLGLEPSIDTRAFDVSYVRAKVTYERSKMAWTQPIFLRYPEVHDERDR